MVVKCYLILVVLRLPWRPILLLNFSTKQIRTFIRTHKYD